TEACGCTTNRGIQQGPDPWSRLVSGRDRRAGSRSEPGFITECLNYWLPLDYSLMFYDDDWSECEVDRVVRFRCAAKRGWEPWLRFSRRRNIDLRIKFERRLDKR
ncbi:PDZ and LIM domain protein 1, partial [Striga asiatica]